MIKAFLSHSTVDKQFVRSVAEHLGRQFCLVDEQVFDSATTFKASIEKHLDETSVFVLFASNSSVKATWVNFEIDEAAHRAIDQTIARALVIIIDSAIDHNAVAPWLRRAKIIRANVSKLAAREIRQHIDDLLRIEQHQFFEGRTDDLSKFQRLITPLDQPPPRVIALQVCRASVDEPFYRLLPASLYHLDGLLRFLWPKEIRWRTSQFVSPTSWSPIPRVPDSRQSSSPSKSLVRISC
jgi:hypothetical protein